MDAHRKLTYAQLCTEAEERFGADAMTWAFRCPHCGDVASANDFIAANTSPNFVGLVCVGRHLGALDRNVKKYTGRGCDWSAGGLIRGPWEVVMPPRDGLPERSVWSFPLADAPVPAEVSA
jgi:hypothetical protein